jgi:hypothetical protein
MLPSGRGAVTTACLVIAFGLVVPGGPAAQGVSGAQAERPPASTATTQTFSELITFVRPQYARSQRAQLRRFAAKLEPSPRNAFSLQEVMVDVYVSDNATEFEKAAAPTLSNDTHRRLIAYGVPRDRISHAIEPRERAGTRRGTWQVEVTARGTRP